MTDETQIDQLVELQESNTIPEQGIVDSNTNLLNELASKYNTDKLKHGYLPKYAENLPKSARSYLEVGIAKGASLQMFNEYWNELVDIHCIDMFLDHNHVTVRWCRKNAFVPYMGSQSDINFLSTIKQSFDVISEDASHNSYDQIVTFKHLFVNNMNSKGIYFIEDTHCCLEPFYWNDQIESVGDTILGIFKRYVGTGKIQSKFFNEGESSCFEDIIASVEICCEEKLIIIKKK